MSQSTEAVTSAIMRVALDGAALRHQAIAANIANAATPGYQPLKVSFESQLANARQRLGGGEALQTVLADLSPSVEPVDGEGRPALDLQVADMAQNVVQYQALLKGWSKRMSILSAAINEGKR